MVVQMPASHPALPNNRKHGEVERRETSGRQGVGSDEWTFVEFRPARWLVTTLTVLALWLVSPQLGKRGLLVLGWRLAPRRLRLIAGGAAALSLVLVAGSVAAVALAFTQLV